jgi:hypothetical protein
MTKKRIWLTPEQKNEVALRYAAGEPAPAIAESLGVCSNNIYNTVRRLGLKIRDPSTAASRISYKKDAFDVVTPESAYWIGFLFADGWTYEQKRKAAPIISVGLAARDRGHLVKLRDFLGSGHAISEIKNKNSKFGEFPGARLTISSRELYDALCVHGMRNKSLDRVATPELSRSKDFWRGLIDGDGYLGIPAQKIRFGLCGGRVILEQFMAFLANHGIGHRTTIRAQGKIFRIDMNCGPAEAAIRLFYSEPLCAALDRKNCIAQAILRGDLTEARRLGK